MSLEAKRMQDLGRYCAPKTNPENVEMPLGDIKKLYSINNVPLHTIRSKVERHSSHTPTQDSYPEDSAVPCLKASERASEIQENAIHEKEEKKKKLANFQAQTEERMMRQKAALAAQNKENRRLLMSAMRRYNVHTNDDWYADSDQASDTPQGLSLGTSAEYEEISSSQWDTSPALEPPQPPPPQQQNPTQAGMAELVCANRAASKEAWGALRSKAAGAGGGGGGGGYHHYHPTPTKSQFSNYSWDRSRDESGMPEVREVSVMEEGERLRALREEALKVERRDEVRENAARLERQRVQERRAAQLLAHEEELNQAQAERERLLSLRKAEEDRQAALHKQRTEADIKASSEREQALAAAASRRAKQNDKLRQHRFNKALHDRLVEKVTELKVSLPALCSCPHGLSPLDELYCFHCSNNCPLYRDPDACSSLLGHMLHTFQVIPQE